jgi:hypothetical protein
MTRNPDDETVASDIKTVDEADEWTSIADQKKSTSADVFDQSSFSMPAQNFDDANRKPTFLATPFAKDFVNISEQNRDTEINVEFLKNSDHKRDAVLNADKDEEAPNQVSIHKIANDDALSDDGAHDRQTITSEQGFWRSQKFWILIGVLLVIVIILAIILGISLGGNNDGGDRDIVIPPTPSGSPNTVSYG